MAGLVFDNSFLIMLSLGLVGFQLILIPLLGFISFSEQPIEDKEVKPDQTWMVLGRISSIVGIVSFILNIILIIIGSTI